MARNIFKGLGIALITPFTPEGEVDYKSLKRLVEHQLNHGADFFCILATTAEAPCLTQEEKDKTEVYWIHFTGSNVKNILRQYGFPDKERVFQVGTSNEYEQIFKRIIIELQRCQDNYEEMLVLLLRHLLISFHRELTREHILKNEYLDHEMDNAVTFFSENYNQNINIDDYAASRGMSVSWFIRNFKKYTGSTPMQFIVGIRINNAQMLLETTTYSINEISKIVGYDNQLYFSRLFHKLKGYSPREYRKIRNKF